MKRNCKIEDISDGKTYHENDMVKIGCRECSGCSQCCQNMEDTIVLDPYDCWNLTKGTRQTLPQLLKKELNLKVTDGVILPHLSMDSLTHTCYFLTEDGRCKIHCNRPGICRLFPLGRLYGDMDFTYFLQSNECPQKGKTKVKIEKWIDQKSSSWYHTYILQWHNILVYMASELEHVSLEEARTKNLWLLNEFYFFPYQNFSKEFDTKYKNLNLET